MLGSSSPNSSVSTSTRAFSWRSHILSAYSTREGLSSVKAMIRFMGSVLSRAISAR
ncbi:hypothetical protein SALBM217S_05864 [Streptomyces griseoloalbus]